MATTSQLVYGNLNLFKRFKDGEPTSIYSDSFLANLTSDQTCTLYHITRQAKFRNGISGIVLTGGGVRPENSNTNESGSGTGVSFVIRTPDNAAGPSGITGQTPKLTKEDRYNGVNFGASENYAAVFDYLGTGVGGVALDGSSPAGYWQTGVDLTCRLGYIKCPTGATGMTFRSFGNIFGISTDVTFSSNGTTGLAYTDQTIPSAPYNNTGAICGAQVPIANGTSKPNGTDFIYAFTRIFIPNKLGFQLDFCGYSGMTSTKLLSNCTSGVYQTHTSAVGSTLGVYWVGRNDIILTQAQITANILSFTSGSGITDWILVSPHQNAQDEVSGGVYTPQLNFIRDAMVDAVNLNPLHLALVNTYDYFVPALVSDANYLIDHLHPNTYGQAALARFFLAAVDMGDYLYSNGGSSGLSWPVYSPRYA